jgi:hypothetical protein
MKKDESLTTIGALLAREPAASPPTSGALRLADILRSPPSKPAEGALSQVARALFQLPAPGSEEFIQAVWEKAQILPQYNSQEIRADVLGYLIMRSHHGKYSDYGWHCDHVIPAIAGGSDELHNQQPLHWRNNLAKSDKL